MRLLRPKGIILNDRDLPLLSIRASDPFIYAYSHYLLLSFFAEQEIKDYNKLD